MSEHLQAYNRFRVPLIATLTLTGALALVGCEGEKEDSNIATAAITAKSPISPKPSEKTSQTANCKAVNYDKWKPANTSIQITKVIMKNLGVDQNTAETGTWGPAVCSTKIASADILKGVVNTVIPEAEGACTVAGIISEESTPPALTSEVFVACVPSPIKALKHALR